MHREAATHLIGRRQLGGDEYLVARDAALADGLSHLGLIAVDGGRVDQAVSHLPPPRLLPSPRLLTIAAPSPHLERAGDGGDAIAPDLKCSQPQTRQGPAMIERDDRDGARLRDPTPFSARCSGQPCLLCIPRLLYSNIGINKLIVVYNEVTIGITPVLACSGGRRGDGAYRAAPQAGRREGGVETACERGEKAHHRVLQTRRQGRRTEREGAPSGPRASPATPTVFLSGFSTLMPREKSPMVWVWGALWLGSGSDSRLWEPPVAPGERSECKRHRPPYLLIQSQSLMVGCWRLKLCFLHRPLDGPG
jgi:hypothetical protein